MDTSYYHGEAIIMRIDEPVTKYIYINLAIHVTIEVSTDFRNIIRRAYRLAYWRYMERICHLEITHPYNV